jgi:hypothetical protein
MSDTLTPDSESRFRLLRLISRASLAIFGALLVWQLVVLSIDGYPEHILPFVKVVSGTQESIPIAYTWTIYLAVITVAGVLASLIGCVAISLRLRGTGS